MMKKLLIALCILLLPCAGFSAENDKKIKLLVILDQPAPHKVVLASQGDLVADLVSIWVGGIFHNLIVDATQESRNKKYGARLTKLLGDYPPVPLYKEYLIKEFARQSDLVELKVLEPAEARQYTAGKKPDFKALQKGGWPYVLLVQPIAGYTTRSLGKVVVSSELAASLYDTGSGQKLFDETPLSFYVEPIDVEQALSDKEFFTSNFEKPLSKACELLYKRLNGTDALYTMAGHFGLPGKFAPLKSYAQRFTFLPHLPKGWQKPASGNDFLFIAEPKKDNAVLAIVTDVDLLIEEFGQNHENLNDYYALRFSRLKNVGWDLTTMAEVPPMALTAKWDTFNLADPRGGRAIFLHRKVKGEFILNHQIVLLGENHQKFFEQYKSQIESYINDSVLETK